MYKPLTVQIGPTLKRARQQQKLSLRALGARTGFSASFLSQVELGQASPSLASLEKIAGALGLTLGQLLNEPVVAKGPIFRRRNEEGLRSEWSKASLQSLLPAGAHENVSVLLVRLAPGGRSGEPAASSGGRQLALCIRGRLVLTVDGTVYELREGDNIFLDSVSGLRWENRGRHSAELLLVHLRDR
ncbi:helix-turn-helix domain-containing protein [Myxococcus sp. SDU36]|uniref:helix-turn-helix domain-containing protein n=1 Tax=Myxococcus sp. SDU36 TaxID=2831967 RepID=UPI002542F090|nr:helix-turn-helix domain-containing protein [Myxococcus sp. SDU36]WIG97915.1 helix-turn-helix domain-containing protein [Myxococcus sp. SDU36]